MFKGDGELFDGIAEIKQESITVGCVPPACADLIPSAVTRCQCWGPQVNKFKTELQWSPPDVTSRGWGLGGLMPDVSGEEGPRGGSHV